MDLVLSNLQRLICHKTQTSKQLNKVNQYSNEKEWENDLKVTEFSHLYVHFSHEYLNSYKNYFDKVNQR